MYLLLLLGGWAISVWVFWRGLRTPSRTAVVLGAAGFAGTCAFFALLNFWGEMLWFDALGFSGRFWTEVYARLLLAAAAAAVAFGWAWLSLRVSGVSRRRAATAWICAGLGALWGVSQWKRFLLYAHAQPTGSSDPILGVDTGFYLFHLPFWDSLYWLLLGLALVHWMAAAKSRWSMARRVTGFGHLLRIVAEGLELARFQLGSLLLVLAWGLYLGRFHLMYSQWGAVSGPGWTDVHLRLPAFGLTAVVTALAGLALLVGSVRARLRSPQPQQKGGPRGRVRLGVAALAAFWLAALLAVPGLLQALLVTPNEITYERPYIAHNIEFTRQAFGLDRAEEREFPVSEEFTRGLAEENRGLLDEVRLWDWRALKAVHKQFQEIRLYYEFDDVDIDRYTVGGRYRQVMISTREMEVDNLPADSRTFVNRRFKYTHGYGLTMTPVSEFTPEGLPNFLVQNIPPEAAAPELEVTRPEIYYGELTHSPVYVNTSEEEFDFPRGDQNVYRHYSGGGGVELTGLWRKFVYGWKFDGTKFFLSSYPRQGSRILFHRNVADRVRTLAPFLRFDDDPYAVLHEGRLYWFIDAFTYSRYYPYSEPFSSRERIGYSAGQGSRELERRVVPELNRANYVRNSVKAVVDTFEGSVTFYVFEPEDPIIRLWQRVFPGMFRPRSEMPAGLEAHVRYPADQLLVQGLVLAKYHMRDPEVFYNQEDLWVRATEKYFAAIQPVEPYYVMWEPPGSDSVQFVLIQPFTPKNRQVVIGWMAGMCDGDDYGRLVVYKFPKEKRVLGPQQVETKIDQDRFLSGQLTLWDQPGSQVIRGNVLAIPVRDTLLYVEPIYLQAETAAYPELRLVAVMHGDQLSYAENLELALEGLFEGAPVRALEPGEGAPAELARRAREAFERYLELQAEGRFREAGAELEQLRELLARLAAPPPSRP